MGQLIREKLKRHQAVQAGVLRLVHHAHATPAQFLKDAVVRNRNPEECVGSCHSSVSHLRWQLRPGLFRHHVRGAPVGLVFVAFDLGRRHQYGSAFILNQEHHEFRGFSLAGVSPDDVNIQGTFIEGLTRCESHFLSAPHLHHD